MTYARRAFAGAAAQTTIVSTITGTTLTIAVVAATGWPSGAEFYAVIDPGQASEEKILCTRSGTTLSCASTAKRGIDGTAAAAHSAGAVIYPCVSAADLDEANLVTSALTTKGDVYVYNGTTIVRLPVGTNGQVLTANSATATGLEWVTPS